MSSRLRSLEPPARLKPNEVMLTLAPLMFRITVAFGRMLPLDELR